MKLSKFDALYKSIITQGPDWMEEHDKYWKERFEKELRYDLSQLEKFDDPNYNWSSLEGNLAIGKALFSEHGMKFLNKYMNKIPDEFWKKNIFWRDIEGITRNKLPQYQDLDIFCKIKDKIGNESVQAKDFWKMISKDNFKWNSYRDFDPHVFSEKQLEQLKDYIVWPDYLRKIAAERYQENKNLPQLSTVFLNKLLNDGVFNKYSEKSAIWSMLPRLNAFTRQMAEKYKDKISWSAISDKLTKYMKDPEFFKEGNKDKFNGFDMDFVRKYKDKIVWYDENVDSIHKIWKDLPENIKKEFKDRHDKQQKKFQDAHKEYRDRWSDYMNGVAKDINARIEAGLQRYDGLD